MESEDVLTESCTKFKVYIFTNSILISLYFGYSFCRIQKQQKTSSQHSWEFIVKHIEIKWIRGKIS